MGKYCCELVKPEEPDELAAPQDFRGFYGVSQYWRLTVCSNFGKPETRVRGVQFYGIGGYSVYTGVSVSAHLVCVCLCACVRTMHVLYVSGCVF